MGAPGWPAHHAEGCVVCRRGSRIGLNGQIGLVSERGIGLVDTDLLAYAVLSALRIVALNHRSGSGTNRLKANHLRKNHNG